jgi:hypothetical protein
MRHNLDTFLAARGTTVDRLVEQVDHVFGAPRLIVAAGSVIQGFGNPTSDVDLLVLVDNDKVSRFPVPSYDGDQGFDLVYLDIGWVRRMADAAADGSLCAIASRPAEWVNAYEDLLMYTRLPLGAPLYADPEWRDWLDQARGARLHRTLHRWWVLDALRYWCAARLLREAHPLLAAERYCDAGIALLHARATMAGEPYFHRKWVAAKLERLGDGTGLSHYRRLLTRPLPDEDPRPYLQGAEEILTSLSAVHPDSPGLRLCATYAPGATVLRFNGRALVSRWVMRGMECDDAVVPPVPPDGAPIWEGSLARLPGWLADLCRADLVWLGIFDWGGHDDPVG